MPSNDHGGQIAEDRFEIEAVPKFALLNTKTLICTAISFHVYGTFVNGKLGNFAL